MRPGLAALLVTVALAATGCGSTAVAQKGGAPGADAATLVPADAIALVSADSSLDSEQWRRLDQLTTGLQARTRILGGLRAALGRKGLDPATVKQALGPELDLAVLGVESGKPEAIALAKPTDISKLRELAATFDRGAEHYTVEEIGGWAVVADTPEAFAKVRAASAGRSLADVAAFRDSASERSDDALAHVWIDGATVTGHAPLVSELLGRPTWIAASLTAERDAVVARLAASATRAPVATASGLLDDVPAGATLAIAVPRLDGLLGRKVPARLAPLLTGPAVLYVKAGGLIPVFALELRPANPQRAAVAARALVAGLRGKAGAALPLEVRLQNGKVIVTDAPAAGRPATRLADDAAFTDALASAGAPADAPLLAYARVDALLPTLQLAAPLLGRPLPPATGADLARLRTVVFAAWRDGGLVRAVVRLELGSS